MIFQDRVHWVVFFDQMSWFNENLHTKTTTQDWDFGTTNLRSRLSFSPNTPRTPRNDHNQLQAMTTTRRQMRRICRGANITDSSFQTLGILSFKGRDTLKPSHKWVLQKSRGWLIHMYIYIYTYNMITYTYIYVYVIYTGTMTDSKTRVIMSHL